ncbi:TIGR03560 family F420-dependent LLM class oxidoreductase [Mycolicibacterium sp. 018/SC-01/001]|uniref:TIGR03560 family F420-dependent LLM class oxidoreductase n=1 Tax=Mycolicibacterium sp. 018/SC-01/001 TaxID=2592069 RepID=UPI00117F0621|nr:TIGR03560 family F420-dependent LLM class oxidoreductase [Mycolicibacterium sp. 018/SC-01/001]TRW89147.1 TIGR03560 family F420-dependent LLM class oxidoreductase [Mycolicibacterium sp. 018/SC-01/001]
MDYSLFQSTGFVHDLEGFATARHAYDRLVDVAQAADESGYRALLVPDHFTGLPPTKTPLFEAWTLITALAGRTHHLKLGLQVSSAGYRNPALAAKMASTLDVISNGRTIFGLGTGWHEPDYTQYGYPFEPAKQRLQRLDEAAQIALKLWTEDAATFDGQYYRIHDAINEPKGIQRPHIPLLIAGSGEKVTLRTVARLADISNVIGPPDLVGHKYSVLKDHADAVGRDFDEIRRTVMVLVHPADTDERARLTVPQNATLIYPGDVSGYGLVGTFDTIHQRISAYEQAGVQELVLHFADPTNPELVTEFAAAVGISQ